MDTNPLLPDSRPNPDPTVLTTEQLERMKEIVFREISASREIIESKLFGARNVLETRLEGMDKAIELVRQQNDVFPLKIKSEVENLKNLHQEKFDSIATQFFERDTRNEQTLRDSKVAVDAALQAAKEAVGEQNKSNAMAIAKSEATFTKQIDQIGVLLASMAKGFDDKVDDIKSRLQSIESQKKGASEVWAIWLAITGLLVGLLGGTAAFVSMIMKMR